MIIKIAVYDSYLEDLCKERKYMFKHGAVLQCTETMFLTMMTVHEISNSMYFQSFKSKKNISYSLCYAVNAKIHVNANH